MGQGPPRAKADLVSGGPVVWSGEGVRFKSLFDLSIFSLYNTDFTYTWKGGECGAQRRSGCHQVVGYRVWGVCRHQESRDGGGHHQEHLVGARVDRRGDHHAVRPPARPQVTPSPEPRRSGGGVTPLQLIDRMMRFF